MEITLHDVRFRCPHCGHINKYRYHTLTSFITTDLIYCDEEGGGCGTKMVLKTELKITHKIRALKIQGINPPKELIEGFKKSIKQKQ